jgi:predicted DNA-binding transcriptional regulator YafY
MEVSVRYASIESGVLELLALGPGVEVIKPPELRERLHAAASEVAAANVADPAVRRR